MRSGYTRRERNPSRPLPGRPRGNRTASFTRFVDTAMTSSGKDPNAVPPSPCFEGREDKTPAPDNRKPTTVLPVPMLMPTFALIPLFAFMAAALAFKSLAAFTGKLFFMASAPIVAIVVSIAAAVPVGMLPRLMAAITARIAIAVIVVTRKRRCTGDDAEQNGAHAERYYGFKPAVHIVSPLVVPLRRR